MQRLLFACVLSLTLAAAFAADPAVQTYNSEDGARVHCPLDKIVWLDTRSHLYYNKGTKHYANTANGGFACLKDVKAAGNKAGKDQ